MFLHPVVRALIWALSALVTLIVLNLGWHQAQRSYREFRCDGDLNARGDCVNVHHPSGADDPALVSTVPLPPEPVALPRSMSVAPSATTLTLSNAPAPLAAPIAALNLERTRAGLSALQPVAALSQAAVAHSLYLVNNHRFAHEEQPGTPGFLGELPVNRMKAVNYGRDEERIGTGEVVATLDGTAQEGVDHLMTAIYHRFVMLTPIFQDVGAGIANDGNALMLTMDFAVRASQFSPTAASLVVYPYNQQVNVPDGFIPGHEIPNPVPERQRVGYPISVQTAPDHTLNVAHWTVRAHGESSTVPGKILTASTDPEVTGYETAFIPWDPLRPSTTYDVVMDGTLDNQAFNVQWAFTTAAAQTLTATVDQPVLHWGERTWVRFSPTDATSWQVSMHASGSSLIPLSVLTQSARGMEVIANGNCTTPSGCPVTLQVVDNLGEVSRVQVQVMPRSP